MEWIIDAAIKGAVFGGAIGCIAVIIKLIEYIFNIKKDKQTLSKEIYAEALNEFENNRDEQLWTKYFAESDGDESKAKARYLKDRAEILGKEGKNQVNNLSHEEREEMYQSLKDYKDGKL